MATVLFYGILGNQIKNLYQYVNTSRKWHKKLVEPHMQKILTIPTLLTGLYDSITHNVNMSGSTTNNFHDKSIYSRKGAEIFTIGFCA